MGEIFWKGLKTAGRGIIDTSEGYGLDMQILFEF
jgi:hypothetical protein